MNHKGTLNIQTERLILRKFEIDDAEYMFKNWANDDEVTKYLRWPTHENVEITKMVLTEWVKNSDRLDYYQWAIVLKGIDEPIGSIGVVDLNEKTNMVHIGYCIGKKWWNKGITSEALMSIIEYFFNEIKVDRIESMHDPNNPNSGKVMMKCKMKYEGTHRKSDWNNQGIVDASYYSILKSEYKE